MRTVCSAMYNMHIIISIIFCTNIIDNVWNNSSTKYSNINLDFVTHITHAFMHMYIHNTHIH